MKGLVDTATFLRSVLNKEVGLRTGKLMSHVSVFEIEGIDRLILLTDAAFNTYPDLKQKVQIINNSVMVAKSCGIENIIPLVISTDLLLSFNSVNSSKDNVVIIGINGLPIILFFPILLIFNLLLYILSYQFL